MGVMKISPTDGLVLPSGPFADGTHCGRSNQQTDQGHADLRPRSSGEFSLRRKNVRTQACQCQAVQQGRVETEEKRVGKGGTHVKKVVHEQLDDPCPEENASRDTVENRDRQ